MSIAAPELPTDVKTLQALVLATRAQLDSAIAERDVLIIERDAAKIPQSRLHSHIRAVRLQLSYSTFFVVGVFSSERLGHRRFPE